MSENKKIIRDKEIAEWIAQVPNELEVDAVGLFQIIPYARKDFGLDQEELKDCIRRHIHALLERGARPVRGGAVQVIIGLNSFSMEKQMTRSFGRYSQSGRGGASATLIMPAYGLHFRRCMNLGASDLFCFAVFLSGEEFASDFV